MVRALLLSTSLMCGLAAGQAIPAGAIRVRVNSKGFEPAKVEIPAGRAVTLAITREDEPNCGSQVVFPEFGIKRNLPIGGTVLIELPPQKAGELHFACGMNMYRGLVVVSR
jgi:plastocyanin domain-containing protein